VPACRFNTVGRDANTYCSRRFVPGLERLHKNDLGLAWTVQIVQIEIGERNDVFRIVLGVDLRLRQWQQQTSHDGQRWDTPNRKRQHAHDPAVIVQARKRRAQRFFVPWRSYTLVRSQPARILYHTVDRRV